jgi:hypothetical protein
MRHLTRWSAVLLVAAALWWMKVYFVDAQKSLGERPYAYPETMTLDSVKTEYTRSIEPILQAKCFQCHDSTDERPFFYSLPVVGPLVLQKYVNREIAEGRAQFDFSKGLPTDRIGAAMEFILGVREVASSATMPPLDYAMARPSSFLSAEERRAMIHWAAGASKVMWSELDATEPAGDVTRLGHEELEAIAQSMIAACPRAEPHSVSAWTDCAQRLVDVELLRDGMRDPMLWGTQQDADDHTFINTRSTRLSPRVWRKLYASLYMYGPDYRIVEDGDQTILRLPVVFRDQLSAGNYPYPFWHEPKKWAAYATRKEMLVIVRDGTIVGALRGVDRRGMRSDPPIWDRLWRWEDDDGKQQPVSGLVYANVLSPSNPNLEQLDAAFRTLALGLRDADCMACHSPDNTAQMKMLELFSYPNQALSARNRIVTTLELNEMPPVRGIEDEEKRRILYEKALEFQQIANQALLFEEQHVEDRMDRPAFERGS